MWQWGVASKCSPLPLKFNWIGLLPIQLNLFPTTHIKYSLNAHEIVASVHNHNEHYNTFTAQSHKHFQINRANMPMMTLAKRMALFMQITEVSSTVAHEQLDVPLHILPLSHFFYSFFFPPLFRL